MSDREKLAREVLRLALDANVPIGQIDERARSAIIDNVLARFDAALSSDAVRVPDKPTPALHEGGRFADWSSVDLAAQCLSQAREQLDPEFSQFMTAVAQRLAASPASPSLGEVNVTVPAEEPARLSDYGSPTIPAGMALWNGGDSAPEDWDGGPVVLRDGRSADPDVVALDWVHMPDEEPHLDIIAYTRSADAK